MSAIYCDSRDAEDEERHEAIRRDGRHERTRGPRRRIDGWVWRDARRVEDLEVLAQRLVRGSGCAPLGPTEGIRAGRWRRQFAGRGITLHQADSLIAAATAGIEARLATGNPADFPMDDITIEHWPVEH